MLVGLISSVPVSVTIQPGVPTSTITLSAAYRLELLPLFDRSGLYTCNTSLSVPTNNGFYTSKVTLQCSHTPGECDIILGSDWTSACGATLCTDGSGLVDPPHPAVTSLPPGHCWSPNKGKPVMFLDANSLLSFFRRFSP